MAKPRSEARFAPTVRVRTTIVAALFAGLTLTIGSLALVRILDHSLVRNGDGLARARTLDLVDLAQRGALPATLTNVGENDFAQVVSADGRVLAASPNITGSTAFLTVHPAPDEGAVLAEEVHGRDDNEAETYRVWFRSADGPAGLVTAYVGTSLESVPEASLVLRGGLLVGVPLAVALIGWCSWLLTGRALRPVEAIRAEVAGISEQALDRRVPVPAADDEVRRLAVTMNQMLDRLDDGHRRQRDFVADASHELQSPLAAIRAQLEVTMAHPDRTDWQTLVTDLLSDTDQMERLVRDLLFLARDGVALAAPARQWLDLDDLVLEECARARSSTGLVIDSREVSAAPVRGDADELRRMIRNLLDNAVRHARARIVVSLAQADGLTRLDVVDDGPGVPLAERARIFDRFQRGDTARTQGEGTGLGLAIALSVARRHGGTLEVVDSPSGAHFAMTLPG